MVHVVLRVAREQRLECLDIVLAQLEPHVVDERGVIRGVTREYLQRQLGHLVGRLWAVQHALGWVVRISRIGARVVERKLHDHRRAFG